MSYDYKNIKEKQVRCKLSNLLTVKVKYVGTGHLFNLCSKPIRGRILSE